MNILHINGCNFGSTGNIMLQIAEKARMAGHNVYVAYPDSRTNRKKTVHNYVRIGNRFERNLHIKLSNMTGLEGCYSIFATKSFIAKISELEIDTIHLHNLHGWYINLPIIFNYIKKKNIRVVWTLHDCWAFTGHCPYFSAIKCFRWKSNCEKCAQYKHYPESFIDNSRYMHQLKQKWFSGINSMTLVTPSEWLADLVRSSFLKEYRIKVVNNGIDTSVFKLTESDFKKKYNCEDKYIVLGVAHEWGPRKGLDVFVNLSARMSNEYQFVLVGTTDDIAEHLPANIISINRTNNQTELAKIYSAADLFVNPTREDNFPTVNIEALACGTPIVTFDTGGSPEIINETCGIVVKSDDIDELAQKIELVRTTAPFTQSACLERAKKFDKEICFEQYIQIYEQDVSE